MRRQMQYVRQFKVAALRLSPLELDLNEKQIPHVIGNNRKASRKWKARKELSSLQSRGPLHGITDSPVPFRLASKDSQEPFFRSGFPPPGF